MTSANKKNALLVAWRETLARRSGDAAVFGADGTTLRTFEDIQAEACGFARKLRQFDCGDVIAIQIGNSPQWPALLLACMHSGLIPLPLGRHIEKAERESAIAICGAIGIVELSGGDVVISRNQASRTSPPSAPTELLKLTFGTSSAPRAIRFRAEQLVSDCENICQTMSITESDVNFGVIPFSHSYGFSSLLMPLLCRGVPLVASEDRMPRAILNGLAQTDATVFPGMPIFYQTFGDMQNLPELPRLRLCISAGAPLSPEVGNRFTKKFCRKIHTFYGASECGGISFDASDSLDYEAGFVGQPLKNVRVRALPDSFRIEVASGAVGDGYFPDTDTETLGSGRFIPVDLVKQNARGLELIGRISEVINVAGRKLNPMEVEAQLRRFPGVNEVVVFGVASALRNEEAVACVVGGGEMDVDRLVHFAHSVLSAWQVPKDIWVVDRIPADNDGRISRSDLARRYMRQRS